MRRILGLLQFREAILAAGPAVLIALVIVLAAFWFAAQFIAPAPPREMVIAAAAKGSPYYQAAQRYRDVLAESGVALKILETKGSVENLALITDPQSKVAAAFLQGGLANSREAPDLRSIGRVFYEPVWVFYQGTAKLERLADLAGKRILIGPAGSATAALATHLLTASGVTADSSTLITQELPDYVAALESGRADAGVLVLSPEAKTIRRLLASPKVKLMDMVQADAYVQRFPFLQKIELKEGVVDFAKDIPPVDTHMLATTAALVIPKDLHPALANLLTQAAIAVHGRPVINDNGESPIFQRAGAFPIADDQEFLLSPEAARVYKSGPPFLQRYLPFWLATWLDRLSVLLLPMIGILLPAVRIIPALYSWRIRRRIIYWYHELKRVEAEVGMHSDPAELAVPLREIDHIEEAVNRLPIPVAFANQLYDLRGHIHVVRRRMMSFKAQGTVHGHRSRLGASVVPPPVPAEIVTGQKN